MDGVITMIIGNKTKDSVLASRARLADNFFTRLRGLLGTKGLESGEGLVIRPCSSVHTFFMGYAIDVVFVGADHRVLKTVPDLVPGRLAACLGSRYVIELPAGTLAATATEAGDWLTLQLSVQG
jgi:uncharacterized membrane protein (UPF0127 family)